MKHHKTDDRREHAGGAPTVAFDGTFDGEENDGGRRPVIVSQFDYQAVEEHLGLLKEVKPDDEGDRQQFGVVVVTRWQLEPYVREENISGRTRQITMRPMLSCYLKTLCIQLSLRPQCLGLPTPTLEACASVAGVSKQCLGRIFVSLREAFPGFVTMAMRSDRVRALYREAQLAAQDEMPDDFAHPQLSLF